MHLFENLNFLKNWSRLNFLVIQEGSIEKLKAFQVDTDFMYFIPIRDLEGVDGQWGECLPTFTEVLVILPFVKKNCEKSNKK